MVRPLLLLSLSWKPCPGVSGDAVAKANAGGIALSPGRATVGAPGFRLVKA